MNLPKLPPIPLPSNVVNHLQLGMDALETLRDIDMVVSASQGADEPWLPEHLCEQIRLLIDQADEVY